MNNKYTCGSCSYWDHANKRNCSNPDTPLYYSECLYPVDELVLPLCMVFEETSEADGTNCLCFARQARHNSAAAEDECKQPQPMKEE